MSLTVDDFVTRVSSLLAANGRKPAADALKTSLAKPFSGKPVVYVVGEDKRGKSTLVNALLGVRDASPTGVEVVTAAPITFFQTREPRALVYRYGVEQAETLDVAAGLALATVAANPGNAENVRSVQIGMEAPILQRLTLVDTPGVGGLESGHGAMTLQSLRRADALLFVLEAGAQFRAPELAFLRQASARVDTVMFALTKIDIHRGWRTVMADNQRILAEQAPRFASAPVFPVSSLLLLRSLDAPDPEDVQALTEESGIPALSEALSRNVAERIDTVRRTNVVRMALSELLRLERTVTDQIPRGNSDDLVKQLEEEKGRLARLKEDRAEWPAQLDLEIRKLTLERTEAANGQMAVIRHRYENRLRGMSKKEFESLPGELIADLTALDSQLNEAAAQRLRAFLATMLEDLDASSRLQDSMAALTDSSLQQQLSALTFGDYKLNSTDKMSIMSMFNRGTSLTSLLSGSSLGLTAGTFLAPPVGLLIGVGVGAVFAVQAFRGRNVSAFGVEFRSWMQEQIAQASLTINSGFQRSVIDLQAGIKKMIRDALSQRETEVTESLASLRKLLETAAGERQRKVDQLEATQGEIQKLKRDAASLFVDLSESDGPQQSVQVPAGVAVAGEPSTAPSTA